MLQHGNTADVKDFDGYLGYSLNGLGAGLAGSACLASRALVRAPVFSAPAAKYQYRFLSWASQCYCAGLRLIVALQIGIMLAYKAS